MATGMQTAERSVDCLILCPHDQDRKVSANLMAMRGTPFFVVTQNCSQNIVSSETTRPIEFKFHIETPYDTLAKIDTNCSGHMPKITQKNKWRILNFFWLYKYLRN